MLLRRGAEQDVRMIQSRHCARRSREAFAELFGRDLDGNLSPHPRIPGAVHFPHPAPIGATISYGPSLLPAASVILVNDFRFRCAQGIRHQDRNLHRKPQNCLTGIEFPVILLGHTPSEFIKDPFVIGNAERYLQLAIQVVLDICNQIVADDRLAPVEEYRDAIRFLGEKTASTQLNRPAFLPEPVSSALEEERKLVLDKPAESIQ